MERRVTDLEDIVGELQDEVRSLRGELRRVRRVVGEPYLEGPLVGGRGSEDREVAESERGSIGSYTLVGLDSEGSRYSPSVDSRPAPSRSPEPSPASPLPSSSVAPTRGRCSLTWAEREGICGDIAAFLVRALSGQARGTSGRDRINLPSRVWLVCRNFEGEDYNPVRVFKIFTLCKDLVKRGPDCGQAVFIGLPSEREARFVIGLAGLSWPADYN